MQNCKSAPTDLDYSTLKVKGMDAPLKKITHITDDFETY